MHLLFGQELPLGLHLLGHRVVLVHGPHPKADGRARLGGLLDLLRLEVGVGYERINRLHGVYDVMPRHHKRCTTNPTGSVEGWV